MKTSGHFTSETQPVVPAPYPSGAPGDWRTFMVGVVLIAMFLSALAFSPIGADYVPGAPTIQDLAALPAPAAPRTEALALQERYMTTVGAESVYPDAPSAEDL